MRSRRDIARLIGAVLCAYLVVAQVIVGGVAMADHAAAMADPFGARCATAASDSETSLPDEPVAAGCCVLGCGPVAMTTPLPPEASVFRYDPRPSPLRALAETETPPAVSARDQGGRPRGPPSIG